MLSPLTALASLLFIPGPSDAPRALTHFDACPHRTGAGATLIVPATAEIETAAGGLEVGDELAVLAPDGSCVGAGVWNGDGIAIAVWEDDPFTPVLDGLLDGDPLAFAAFDASEGVAHDDVTIDYEASFAPAEGYRRDDLYVVAHEGGDEPEKATFALEQNFPNPFRSETTIAFTLEAEEDIRVGIYDALGRLVASPAEGTYGPGRHEVRIEGDGLAPGIYVYRVTVGGDTQQKTLTITR